MLAKSSAPLRSVTVWRSEGLMADDCGDDVARWLSEFLGVACRLVRAGAAFQRPVTKAAARPGDLVAFNDAVPVLGISEASLVDLNDRIVATGEEPFSLAMLLQERLDGWRIEIVASDLSTTALERAREAVWPIAKASAIP